MFTRFTADNIKESYLKLPVFWKLFPLFLVYVAISVLLGHREPIGDENRYLLFANNLINGFYSPPPPEISLWNGPGYPLVVAASLLLGANKMILSVINAILFFISLLFIHKAIRKFSNEKKSLLYTLLAGMYLPIWFYIPLVLTEILTWFLLSVISYLFLELRDEKKVFSITALYLSISIAYLVLTKVIFSYAVVVLIPISLFFLFSSKLSEPAKKILFVFALSLIFCLPYLFYTHSITGKVFYWSNSGSMSLYTMSTPDKSEYGDWKGEGVLRQKTHHQEFIDSILVLTPLERDEAYMDKAINNIKEYPSKYFLNWIANVNRLLFSFPLDDQSVMRTYYSIFKLFPQAILIGFILLTLGAGLRKRSELPGEFILLVTFILIYLGGTSLLSAVERMFYITIPVWTIYMAYIFENILSVNISYRK